MTWREGGREKVWWVDSRGKLVVWWRPILSEYEDEPEQVDPLEILTDKQRFVIELRYGLVDGIEYSQREIAALMGVSHSMVNQHEHAAIKKLSKYLRRTPAPEMLDREGT